MSQLPYVRLSGFYFFWFATLGAMLPYWGLYLQKHGFAPSTIGLAFGVMMASKLIAPTIWGWLADRRGSRIGLIRLAALTALLVFLVLTQVHIAWALILLMGIYGFFWNASLPQFEAITFNHLGEDEYRYGRIRLWGSLGFIISVVSLGPILDRQGIEPLPIWIALGLSGILIASLLAPERRVGQRKEESVEGLMAVMKKPEVFSLMLVCFLSQLSHGPYYTFFSIYMEEFGYSRMMIGWLWALGVIAEVGVFLFMQRLLSGLGPRNLMLLALAATAIRWVLLALLVEYLPALLFAQLLHMASFGIYHAVAVNLIHRMFRGKLQGRGQALYSSLSFGAGGGLGAWLGGSLWEVWPPQAVFLASAAVALLAFVIALLGLRGGQIT